MGIPLSYYLGELGFGLRLGLQGMPILVEFWEWGCPKRVDAHITLIRGIEFSMIFLHMLKSHCCKWKKLYVINKNTRATASDKESMNFHP